MDIEKIADILIDAEENQKEIVKFSLSEPELNYDNAYDIQHRLIEKKLAKGHRVSGMKMGLTSWAKMAQMGIKDPLYGHLLDYMEVLNNGVVSMKELIHPKVESEIAFVFKTNLYGDDLADEQLIEALESAVPVMEIIDSRYENFNFTLPDVIADNCSSSRYVVGEKKHDVKNLAFDKLEVTLSINDTVVDQGLGSAVLGHPFQPVKELAKMLARRGLAIPKGAIVLTGGITKAFVIKAGDVVTTNIESIGEVRFSVVD